MRGACCGRMDGTRAALKGPQSKRFATSGGCEVGARTGNDNNDDDGLNRKNRINTSIGKFPGAQK